MTLGWWDVRGLAGALWRKPVRDVRALDDGTWEVELLADFRLVGRMHVLDAMGLPACHRECREECERQARKARADGK